MRQHDIIEMIGEQANAAACCLDPTNTLDDDLGMDPLDLQGLQLNLEDQIDAPIDDEAWQRCVTVADVINIIDSVLTVEAGA